MGTSPQAASLLLWRLFLHSNFLPLGSLPLPERWLPGMTHTHLTSGLHGVMTTHQPTFHFVKIKPCVMIGSLRPCAPYSSLSSYFVSHDNILTLCFLYLYLLFNNHNSQWSFPAFLCPPCQVCVSVRCPFV